MQAQRKRVLGRVNVIDLCCVSVKFQPAVRHVVEVECQ